MSTSYRDAVAQLVEVVEHREGDAAKRGLSEAAAHIDAVAEVHMGD